MPEALADPRTIIAIFTVFAGLVSGWTYMRIKLSTHDEKIAAKGKAIETLAENVSTDRKESEERILTKLKEMDEHFDGDIIRLSKNQRTIFDKLDRFADSMGDLRVVLTVMAGRMGNPGNDKELIEMIRDIGKKRNGR